MTQGFEQSRKRACMTDKQHNIFTVLGSKKTIPFELLGNRTTVGRITIGLEQRMDRILIDGSGCFIQLPNGSRQRTRCP